MGVLIGTIAGAIIGPLIIRLRGVYFAMVTIAFGQVFFFIAFRWNSVTGGDDGLTRLDARSRSHFGFATIDILNNPRAFYYLVLVMFAVAAAIMAWLLRSPFGRTLIAIRENERRARFLGIPVDQHIWMSWVISCCFVSLAGALYALLNNFVDPRALYWTQSGDFVIMAVLGGMRSFWGPLIGAAIYRRSAGLSVEPDRELAVVHRPVLRPGRAVLPARRARHDPPQGDVMSLLRVENVVQAFRQPDRRRRCVDDGRAGRIARRDRAQRRRKDDVFQHHQRLPDADLRPDHFRRRRHLRAFARPSGVAWHRPHLPDHGGLSRAVGARKSAHRGRGRRRLSHEPLAIARRRRRNHARGSPT